MPDRIVLESPSGGLGMIINFPDDVVITRLNTAMYPNVIELEDIPSGPFQVSPGVFIDYGPWVDVYCVRERGGWDEYDYLDHAKKLLRSQKITKP